MAIDATQASFRFGLGPRPGELATIGADPRGWLAAQLSPETSLPDPLQGFPSTAERAAERIAYVRSKQKTADMKEAFESTYRADAALSLTAAVVSTAPFTERLVRFWVNHFTVSILRPSLRVLALPFEVEAIRPNVFGRFSDLLLASSQHPAMLLYLDNADSVGPNSPYGKRRDRGLNENLGREILELHSLGVDGGYDQDDVRSLAMILTGWSLAGPNAPQPGIFQFRAQLHEPGARSLLGKNFPEGGEEQGRAALAMLATHPATARHLATKLVRHFVADEPPAPAVERLTAVFLEHEGDLVPLYQALIELDAAWDTPLQKVRTPQELVIAAQRAAGRDDEGARSFDLLRQMAQQPFRALSPAGWPDTAADWIGPEAMINRIQWSFASAGFLRDQVAPEDLLSVALGGFATPEVQQAVRRAASRRDALAYVLASPAFQRR